MFLTILVVISLMSLSVLVIVNETSLLEIDGSCYCLSLTYFERRVQCKYI